MNIEELGENLGQLIWVSLSDIGYSTLNSKEGEKRNAYENKRTQRVIILPPSPIRNHTLFVKPSLPPGSAYVMWMAPKVALTMYPPKVNFLR